LHSCLAWTKQMGGSLTVNSDGLGKGTTFTLVLPTCSPLQPASQTDDPNCKTRT
jgi:hypothetical protein